MNIKGRGAVPGQATWAICLGPLDLAESVGPKGGGLHLLKCYLHYSPLK